jgi:CRISPR-associated protein (TIGR02584 family)
MSYPDPFRPETYPCRVLLAVTGLSPQVVTETLYVLARDRESNWVPTEIHLLTTAQGAKHAHRNLLFPDPGWFHRLCRDYGLEGIAFDAQHIHVLQGADGQAISDIRTREDNERAADLIAETVRALTTDEGCALHLSIAGGRKTMGFYAGYALSLFGRVQDRLSHVLVSPPFESHPQFYYPTPYERVIHALDKQQMALDCRNAEVTLANIPFVRLRDGLPERLISGRARFSEVVEAANRIHAEPKLVLDVPNRQAWADGERLPLGPTEFAVLLWIAEHAGRDDPELDWCDACAADEFLGVAKRVMNPEGGDYERLEQALAWRRASRKDLGDYFEPQKSRINGTLQTALGKAAAVRYEIRRTGPKGASRYFLPLAPDVIEIKN